jgi:hypothetical protein
MNPMHIGLALLGKSVGGDMVPLTTSNKRVHGFGARMHNQSSSVTPASATSLYLINKYQVSRMHCSGGCTGVTPFAVFARGMVGGGACTAIAARERVYATSRVGATLNWLLTFPTSLLFGMMSSPGAYASVG